MLTVSFATRNRPSGPTRGRKVNLWRDESGGVFARGFAAADAFGVDWPGLAYFQFTPGSRRVTVWLDAHATPAAARDAVTRVLQPMMLQALGWEALHASGSVLHDGIVAFCGRSGHGKSTIASALARAGAPQFADDAVLLDISGEAVQAMPLPFTPRLRAPSLARLGPAPPPAARAAAPLRAVVVLEQVPGLARAEAALIPAVEAFSVLITHAHCFDPTPGPGSERLVRDMLQLVEHVPVTRLRYPPDFDRLDRTIDLVFEIVKPRAASVTGARATS